MRQRESQPITKVTGVLHLGIFKCVCSPFSVPVEITESGLSGVQTDQQTDRRMKHHRHPWSHATAPALTFLYFLSKCHSPANQPLYNAPPPHSPACSHTFKGHPQQHTLQCSSKTHRGCFILSLFPIERKLLQVMSHDLATATALNSPNN